jgi:exosome complex RNA-binding protein Rrp4
VKAGESILALRIRRLLTGSLLRARADVIDQTSRCVVRVDGVSSLKVIRKVNSLVYARVSLAHKDMEPELECFDAQTRKAEGFGELKEGFLVRCSLKMSRKCVSSIPSYPNSRQ